MAYQSDRAELRRAYPGLKIGVSRVVFNMSTGRSEHHKFKKSDWDLIKLRVMDANHSHAAITTLGQWYEIAVSSISPGKTVLK